MNALTIKNLYKSFGEKTVLDGISFSVAQGSVFGFIAKNGAGKTTTMKIILGLLMADAGEIAVFDEPASYGNTRTNRHIGYLPDVASFYNYMRPLEYLSLCGEVCGLERTKIRTKSLELLSLVGLDNQKGKIGGFSRGMKQRLGIAQALLAEPKLLICDEPTSALDPSGRKEILDLLHSVKDKTTVMFSTHVLSDVERICDSVSILDQGKIVLSGSLSELKARRHNQFHIEFAQEDVLRHFLAILHANHIQALMEDKHIVVSTNQPDTTGEQLLHLLASHSFVPSLFEIAEPTLENLFLEVVQ